MDSHPSLMNGDQVLDRYFLEVRCKLLDIAAIIDRYERSAGPGAWSDSTDRRIDRCRAALQALMDPSEQPNRAERIALIFSDPVE